jgi:HK97 family phage major capsid protein
MFTNQTQSELTKVGITRADVDTAPVNESWGALHDRRKKLRRASEALMKAMPAKGDIPEALNSAYEVIGSAISAISDEIDQREASGSRESPMEDRRLLQRERETQLALARAQTAATTVSGPARNSNFGRPRLLPSVGRADYRPGEPLILKRGDSAAQYYGQPEDSIGDLVKAVVMGDHSNLTPQASQMVGSGGSGGFTVPTALWGRILDLARNKMRIAEAGATMIDAPQSSSLSFPTLESDPTAYWRGELTDITESAAAFGSRNFQPKTVAVLVSGSIELAEDSPTLGQMLMETIASQIALQVDYAALSGNGIGQPLGILNQASVQSVDAAGILTDFDPFARAVQKVRQQNVEPGAFILSPSTLGHIDRLADTTGQPLQPPPSMRDRAFLDTNQIVTTDASPITASAVTGEWESLYAVFRQRLVLEISRTSGDSFKKLGWQARGYARVDSFAVRADRFCKVINLPAD